MFLETVAATSGAYATVGLCNALIEYNAFAGDGALEKVDGPVEGAELYTAKQTYRPPVYLNTGTGHVSVGIPVGNGEVDTEYRRTYSKFRAKDTSSSYTNYWSPSERGRISWINTADQLANVSNRYSIDTSAFPVAFPIRVHEHTWPGPVWHDQKAARIGPNKLEVARAAAWARRFPYSVTAAAVAVVTMFALNDADRRHHRA